MAASARVGAPVGSPAPWPTFARVAIAVIAVAAMVHADAWSFVCDDAFISFRYARNLVEHGELAFNVAPLERVEGYTNFAWVLVIAAGLALGVAPETWAIAISQVAVGALVVLAIAWADRLGRDAAGERDEWTIAGALIAGAWLAACPELVVWGEGGLETAFAAAWVVAAMFALDAARIEIAGACSAIAVLSRPDAVVPLGAFVLVWLVLRAPAAWRAAGDGRGRRVAVAFALAIVPIAGHLLWRRAYYGTWLPNTWSVKAHGARLRESWGIAYVQSWMTAVWLPAFVPAFALVRRRQLPLLAAAVATVAYGGWVGGDFMAYARFYVVATFAIAVVLGAALVRLAGLLAGRATIVRVLPSVLGGGLVIAMAIAAIDRRAIDRARSEGWLDGRWEGVTAMDRFARVGLAAGAALRERVPPGTLVSVGAAGAVPWASELPVVDAYGLVDPELARLPDPPLVPDRQARPGHQLYAPPAYIRRRDPDLLCHVGYRGPRRPAESQAAAPFRAGYVWACVHPPATDAIDPGFYCCRRPRDRIVGVFGTAEEARG